MRIPERCKRAGSQAEGREDEGTPARAVGSGLNAGCHGFQEPTGDAGTGRATALRAGGLSPVQWLLGSIQSPQSGPGKEGPRP